MFTGIVTDIGTIERVEPRGDLRVTVATTYDTASVDLGASIACSGVCLTVVDKGRNERGDWFAVDVSNETVGRTADGLWSVGRRLNLERALKVGDELGGHIVTGHVDGVADVLDACPDGDSLQIRFGVTLELAPYLAAKGSITIDGVSLTVNGVADREDRSEFSVNLIPHTRTVTALDELQPGRIVNIEIDVLARYLQRMEAYRAK